MAIAWRSRRASTARSLPPFRKWFAFTQNHDFLGHETAPIYDHRNRRFGGMVSFAILAGITARRPSDSAKNPALSEPNASVGEVGPTRTMHRVRHGPRPGV